MTIETFQKLLTELLSQYNEEAKNHYIQSLEITPSISPVSAISNGVIYYSVEVKTFGK